MNRRNVLLAALAAAASPAFASGSRTAAKWQPGGTGGMTRCRTGIIGTQMQYGIPSLMLPQKHVHYLLPMDDAAQAAGFFFNESSDVIVGADAQHRVQASGIWRASLTVDWPGQNIDSGLRKITIWCCPAGSPPPPYIPGQLTRFDNATLYKRLAAHDCPGSADVPNADAWTTLNAAEEQLDPGDSIFATVCSERTGDWVQASAMTYLQLTLAVRGQT